MKIVRRSVRSSSQFVAMILAGAAFVGCAELITYSGKSIEAGDKLVAEGRDEDAAGAYRNATQQNPKSYEAFYKLGETYQRLGREQQALQSFHAAVDVMPATPSNADDRAFREKAVNGLAGCIAKAESRDAEITAATTKATTSNKPVDWYVVARTYAITGDADNAIDAYDKAMSASASKDQPIAKSYGLYLAETNQNKKAEPVLVKAYQLKPDDADVNAALRKIGVIPGPSLLEVDQLSKPLIPKGPIPEIEFNVKDKNAPTTPAAAPQ